MEELQATPAAAEAAAPTVVAASAALRAVRAQVAPFVCISAVAIASAVRATAVTQTIHVSSVATHHRVLRLVMEPIAVTVRPETVILHAETRTVQRGIPVSAMPTVHRRHLTQTDLARCPHNVQMVSHV